MKIPGDARVVTRRSVVKKWIPYERSMGWTISMTMDSRNWDSDVTSAWVFEHSSGVYVVWSRWTGKEPKHYPDLDTAKIAVELQE